MRFKHIRGLESTPVLHTSKLENGYAHVPFVQIANSGWWGKSCYCRAEELSRAFSCMDIAIVARLLIKRRPTNASTKTSRARVSAMGFAKCPHCVRLLVDNRWPYISGCVFKMLRNKYLQEC
jgi:hypothetical protein